MSAQLRREAEVGGYEAAAEAQEAIAATYVALAELVGGRSEEIALFDNATHAWNAAFYSVPLRPVIRSSPAAPSTAATCWPTGTPPATPAPRSCSCPITNIARS